MAQLDILFVNTNSSHSTFQSLADKWASIEPPTWSLLLAQSCRSKGYGVAILDAHAEHLTHEQTAQKILDAKPKFCCFVAYGSNPNQSSPSMMGVFEVAKFVKDNSDIKTISIGNHTAALPMEVLNDVNIDYICINEGVYAVHKLLAGVEDSKIPGLGYGNTINSGVDSLVPQERMDIDMPGYAWDLLPYKHHPLDLYRAHLWHAEYQDQYRTPFASLYTSLGCKFKCNFCIINTVNREDTTEGITAANSNIMRFWSPEMMIKEFDKLVNDYGITSIRISDEMFFLNKKYYEPLLTLLKDRGYGDILRMWTYARVDTVNERFLDLFRAGGVKWLALGIEAANQQIRQEIYKGKFQDTNIRDVVKAIHNHGMYVAGNYLFGFENEDLSHLQETLDLSLELNTELGNFHAAMALPGSPLYYEAKQRGAKFPEKLSGYSFFSYDCQPSGTKHLTPAEVLAFRDKAWHQYHENPKFLSMIESKFGQDAKNNIIEMSKIKLKRQILGD